MASYRDSSRERRTVVPALVLCVALAIAVASVVAGPAVASADGPATVDGPPKTTVGVDAQLTIASPPEPTDESTEAPRIESVYPSPMADGDDGETVRVGFAQPVDGAGWRLVDDAGHEAHLPNKTLSGSVAFSPEPTTAEAELSTESVLAVDGRLRLADDGDEVSLVDPAGRTVDSVEYERARDGLRFVRTDVDVSGVDGTSAEATDVGDTDGEAIDLDAADDEAIDLDAADDEAIDLDGEPTNGGTDWRWRHPEATAFEPSRSTPTDATAFVLPDAPDEPVRALRDADDRIRLAGYEFTSERLVDVLLEAHANGVDVEVLVDGSPVGGTSRAQVEALDRLHAAGVDVTVQAGEPRRYATHHPKYAVVDGDRALVLTENWKPAGTGGASSRGWGVWLADGELAASLADVFDADATGSTARDWGRYRSTVDPVEPDRAAGSYPARFPAEVIDVDAATLLLAPDNAERELPAVLRSAEDSIRIQQVEIGGVDDPMLAAVLDAARTGVRVEILLSSAWYVEEENRELAAKLRATSEREDLALSVELADPEGAFGKTHVKGAIVDEETVVLGSLNWNPTAVRENREVLVVLESDDAADYYGRVFEADAGTAVVPAKPAGTPVGLAAAIALAWAAFAALVATRIRWLE